MADFDWNMAVPEAIHVSHFGAAGALPTAGNLRDPMIEWQKGGRVIDYLKANNVRAVIMFGYRYISFRRIIS